MGGDGPGEGWWWGAAEDEDEEEDGWDGGSSEEEEVGGSGRPGGGGGKGGREGGGPLQTDNRWQCLTVRWVGGAFSFEACSLRRSPEPRATLSRV